LSYKFKTNAVKKIIVLGGSNSTKSINKRLAVFAASQLEAVEVIIVDLNEFHMPLFSVDLEAEIGSPENAIKLNALLQSADGLVVSLAEHNGSFSAAFKNAFDWLSRIDKVVWKNKPMLLMATSPGGRGGASVLATATALFPRFGTTIVATFSLPSFHDNFSEQGVINAELSAELNQKINIFQKAI
jgi:chromate reductase, NAD(P)H dehydrogenase (quinone)